MKKNAMCQIAVGVLSTCLAGAALAAGGPGDVCNSNNIHRSAITSIDKSSALKLRGYNYQRTIYNTTGVICGIKFRGDNWAEKRLLNNSNLERKPAGIDILRIDSRFSTTVYGETENDITYERAKTVVSINDYTQYTK